MTDFAMPTTSIAGERRPRLWWLVYIPLTILLIFAVAPLLLAWFAALKSDQQLLVNPWGPPLPPTIDNLVEAWTVGRFSVYFRNSLIISIADVIGMVVIASLASASSSTPSSSG